MEKKLPDSFVSMNTMLCYILLMPIYTFFFFILFKPFHADIEMGLTLSQFAFRASILMSIQLVIVLISRISMKLLKDVLGLNYYNYLFWEFAEVLMLAMFYSLFEWLLIGTAKAYFSILPTTFIYLFLVLIFPYVILALISELIDRNQTLSSLSEIIEKYESGQIGADNSPVHFLDEKNNLKLLVTADTILYIEASDNYSNISYINSGKITKYSLRNTMKGIESVCIENNLIRCHRSYFINLKKVKIIQRGKDGLFAELDYIGTPRVPISKTYSDHVVKKFSSLNG